MPEQYKKRMETASENHRNLSVILLLVLSVGDIPQRHGLQADKPADEKELRKLDEITAQVRYMSKHNISTLSDLHADREKTRPK